MNSIHYPLIGDKLYGKNKVSSYVKKDKKNFNKFLPLKNFHRHALHAYAIGFIHPTLKKMLEFKSKLPNDMLKLLDFLSKC